MATRSDDVANLTIDDLEDDLWSNPLGVMEDIVPLTPNVVDDSLGRDLPEERLGRDLLNHITSVDPFKKLQNIQ